MFFPFVKRLIITILHIISLLHCWVRTLRTQNNPYLIGPRIIHRCLDIPIHHEQCYPALAHCQQLPFPDGPHLVGAFITIPPIRAAKKTGKKNVTCWTFVQHCKSLYKTAVHHGQPSASIAPSLYMSVHAVAAGRFLNKESVFTSKKRRHGYVSMV